MTDEKRIRLYYINVAVAIKAHNDNDKNRSASSGMYLTATDIGSARRQAMGHAVHDICDQPEGTLLATITVAYEISKEVAEGLMKEWSQARPQAEIDADNPEQD